MESLITPLAGLIMFAVFIGAAVTILRYLQKDIATGRVKNLPYLKKEYLLSVPERKLFSTLTTLVPSGYCVFPQLHLSSLVLVKKGTQKHMSYLNKIIRKSVDFTVFEKDFLRPVLVIELDDNTHSTLERMDRDDFVDDVLLGAGIGILHLRTSQLDSTEEIRKVVLQKLGIAS